MLLINKDVENGLFNGSIGVVKHIEYTSTKLNKIYIDVEFLSKEKTLTVRLLPYKEIHDDIVLWQFLIEPAYATSVHKVQGMTLSKIVIGNLSNFWTTQQLYVALSRVRNEESISILRPSCSDQLYTIADFKKIRSSGALYLIVCFLNGIDY